MFCGFCSYYYRRVEENYLIKREVRDHIQFMLQNNRGRFHRDVDTLFFEHIIYFLCNPSFYRDMFGETLNKDAAQNQNPGRVPSGAQPGFSISIKPS